MFEDYDVKLRQSIIEEYIQEGFLDSEESNGKQYVRINVSGTLKLGELIDQISKEILKLRPSWLTLFTIDKLFLVQNEILTQKYPGPEFALVELTVEQRNDNFDYTIREYLNLIESELIELEPTSKIFH